MMTIILWLLVVLGFIFLILLFAPFTYKAYISKGGDVSLYGDFGWLFGAVKISVSKGNDKAFEIVLKVFNIIKIRIDPNKFENKKDKVKKKKKKKKFSDSINGDMISGLISLAKELLSHVKPKKFYMNIRVGFDDPCYTGILCALKYLMQPYGKKFDIHVEPVFEDEVLEGEIDISGIMIIAMLLYYAIKAFKPFIIHKVKYKIKNIRIIRKGNKSYVRY